MLTLNLTSDFLPNPISSPNSPLSAASHESMSVHNADVDNQDKPKKRLSLDSSITISVDSVQSSYEKTSYSGASLSVKNMVDGHLEKIDFPMIDVDTEKGKDSPTQHKSKKRSPAKGLRVRIKSTSSEDSGAGTQLLSLNSFQLGAKEEMRLVQKLRQMSPTKSPSHTIGSEDEIGETCSAQCLASAPSDTDETDEAVSPKKSTRVAPLGFCDHPPQAQKVLSLQQAALTLLDDSGASSDSDAEVGQPTQTQSQRNMLVNAFSSSYENMKVGDASLENPEVKCEDPLRHSRPQKYRFRARRGNHRAAQHAAQMEAMKKQEEEENAKDALLVPDGPSPRSDQCQVFHPTDVGTLSPRPVTGQAFDFEPEEVNQSSRRLLSRKSMNMRNRRVWENSFRNFGTNNVLEGSCSSLASNASSGLGSCTSMYGDVVVWDGTEDSINTVINVCEMCCEQNMQSSGKHGVHSISGACLKASRKESNTDIDDMDGVLQIEVWNSSPETSLLLPDDIDKCTPHKVSLPTGHGGKQDLESRVAICWESSPENSPSLDEVCKTTECTTVEQKSTSPCLNREQRPRALSNYFSSFD